MRIDSRLRAIKRALAVKYTSFAVFIVFRMIGLLPLQMLQHIGEMLGNIAWRMPGSYKRRAATNMRLAYPEADEAQQRQSMQELMCMFLELPYLWAPRNINRLEQLVSCDAWDLIDHELAKGRGLILISPHIGCFEMLCPLYSRRHIATVIYKEPRLKWLAALIDRVRISPQLTMVPANQQGVKGLVRALMRGQTIGLLPDQVPAEGDGVYAPFFGQDAYTVTLVQRLQTMRQTSIFTVGLERLKGGRGYHLHVEPIPHVLSDDPIEAATQMNRALESMIHKMPSQYLWGYNRYKAPRAKSFHY